ncbi:MAG: hypothetical protein HYW90_02580 [Candidatus Sungbacteria bacterium]|nr:hypothetical protein [Candidatus Sungbacteria bacterium]
MRVIFKMGNPYAINIDCDAAMTYDSHQTGGYGLRIEFPDALNLPVIEKRIRSDRQGIHRLEMICMVEAMETLLSYSKKHNVSLRNASGVVIYTDRIAVTDDGLVNPWRISGYRKNKWTTHEGKEVKDKDVLDKLDKTRKKLAAFAGRVEIKYKREKRNRAADKLSREGRSRSITSRIQFQRKRRRVSRRLHDGPEVNYSILKRGDFFVVHVYAREPIKRNYDIWVEIVSGVHVGQTVKIYADADLKHELHLQHVYRIEVADIKSHHIVISSAEELSKYELGHES